MAKKINNTNTNNTKDTLKDKAKRAANVTIIGTTAVTATTAIIDTGVGIVRMVQGVSPTKVAVAVVKDVALTAAITAGTLAAASVATELAMSVAEKLNYWNDDDEFDEEFLNIDDEEFSNI